MNPSLKLRFTITVKVDKPILVGRDEVTGRRQLIPIISGELKGENGMHGVVLPGGIDSQIVRSNGRCDISARYAVKLDNGTSFYIQNDGMRTVPAEYASEVFDGRFVEPSLYYFCTVPYFEVFDETLSWLRERIFICLATRLPDSVEIEYYSVEL